MLNRLSIKTKLGLLAGVPVVGALALASLLWVQAQKGAESAKALGSVEDLAELSSSISGLVHQLQTERALSGLVLGHRGRAVDILTSEDDARKHQALANAGQQELDKQQVATDAARRHLESFIQGRDLTAFPRRLRHDIETSRVQLNTLPEMRSDTDGKLFAIDKRITLVAAINDRLIDATAALTQLSDDGELLRNISALVSVMQVKERASQEHALLANVFAMGQFPPGTYRDFVTLTTQEQVYISGLRSTAQDGQIELYDVSMQTPEAARALSMREKALKTIDEPFGVEANAWFEVQSSKMGALRDLETRLTGDVRSAALAKLHEINNGIRTSVTLSISVLILSLGLALVIARGITQSVGELERATSRVTDDEDFSIRAVKMSKDELGHLTDAFNTMLDGIQHRDEELAEYRQGLEQKVEERTHQLSARNQAMRMVLDNVQQGLATIRADGTLDSERSAMFDQWFGPPENGTNFGQHLGGSDEKAVGSLVMGWEQVTEGFLPNELTLDQMPRQLLRDGRYFTLSYKPIDAEEQISSALLVVNDVTDEVHLLREQAKQREAIAMFERLMRDRSGFEEFFVETGKLVARIATNRDDAPLILRDIHTVKGNCSVFQIHSVAQVCHAVEDGVEPGTFPTAQAIRPIQEAWDDFSARVHTLLGESRDDVVEMRHDEWETLLELAQNRAPHQQLEDKLRELQFEPTEVRFQRIAEQAQRLAERFDKPGLTVEIHGNGLRLPTDQWAPFWSSFAHVLRNAIDHGIEPPEQRRMLNKSEGGHLTLLSSVENGMFCIELQDDGTGIAWDQVRDKARRLGLPHETRTDLEKALFCDGFSTRQAATELSGRGVGMAAMRQAVEAMQGRWEIRSESGRGAAFRFLVPVAHLARTTPHGEAANDAVRNSA